MTAITSAKGRDRRNTHALRSEDYVVASGQTIPQGALVAINTASREAYNATDAASRKFVGIAAETVVGDGVKRIKVEFGHDELLTISANILDSHVNSHVCVLDNDGCDTATAATNDVFVGVVRKLESATTAWIGVRVVGFASS